MARIDAALRFVFFLFVRLVVLILLGLNVRHRERLPRSGPAILAANHNSHLDTMVLITLLPLRLLPKIRPVAAADYFLKNRLLRWFSLRVIGILPLDRHAKRGEDVLASCVEALARGEILILFPEGSRGEPEQMSSFKSGIAHLSARCPAAPVIPIFMHGLGKALPRGDAILVPYFCDIFVGEALAPTPDRHAFMDQLEARFAGLQAEGDFRD